MIKTLFLSTGALGLIMWAVVRQDQLDMFTGDWFSPLFVIFGGISMALSVDQHVDNLFVRQLEAFRTGTTLFGIIGVLIGLVCLLAAYNDLAKWGPAIALALLTLLWAAVLNYVAKLVIISKSGGV